MGFRLQAIAYQVTEVSPEGTPEKNLTVLHAPATRLPNLFSPLERLHHYPSPVTIALGWTPRIRSSKPEGQSERPTSFTRRAIAAYIGLVLIPHDEIWWMPFSEVRGRHSVCTNIERDGLAEYRGATDALKKWQQKWHQQFECSKTSVNFDW